METAPIAGNSWQPRTQLWTPKLERETGSPHWMNKAKREGISGTNCQDDELPLQTILQVHAQSTCKNASNKEHIEFWRMCLSKNCWLVENADATCTIKGALDSNRVVKKILRASWVIKKVVQCHSSMLKMEPQAFRIAHVFFRVNSLFWQLCSNNNFPAMIRVAEVYYI